MKIRRDIVDGKTRSRYEIDSSKGELSRKVFELAGVEIKEIIVKLEPEEMIPHEEFKVSSKIDFEKETTGKSISLVKFSGVYNGHDLSIIIDYDLSLLSIVSDNERTHDDIKNCLID